MNKIAVERDWRAYHDNTEGRPPRATLLRALDAHDGQEPGLALDLGSGIGRDALEMLRRGWRVVAIDGDGEALERLKAKAGDAADRLETRTERLETAALPPCSLVNASFVLPFVDQQAFNGIWDRIGEALEPGGRFAGQLLGLEDTWVRDGRCFGFDRLQLDGLLHGYEVEALEEEQDDSVTPQGEAKHWHLWHLNLRKLRP